MVTGTKTAYITTKYLDYLDEHAWTFQSGYTWSWYAGHVENNYFQPYYCWAIDGWYSFDNHDTGGGWVTWNGNSHGEWHAWEKEQVHYAVLKVGVVQTWYITNDFYVYADGHYTWHHSE
jgi:hypothetical protein